MDTAILQVSYLSVAIVVLLGLLFILILFWSKAKRSGFQSRQLDETSRLLTYEQMLRQGKLTKEEYDRIHQTLLKKHGFSPGTTKDINTEEPKTTNSNTGFQNPKQ
ncbi:MAG: hypothetical protein N3A72_00455 [bacterium]|nr:hypothetical protein [bacterium]